MKMKTAGDIFTATSMGWGWVNIALTLQISLVEGGGVFWKKKKVCAWTGMLRAEGFFKSLCKYRLDIKAIKLTVVHH